MNNTHCRNWPGDMHVGNEQLCIIDSDADGQLFYVAVILTELWIKNSPVVLGCSSGWWDFSIVP